MFADVGSRRVVFKQTDESINLNTIKILEAGLKPILCIGESKEEYDQGLNTQVHLPPPPPPSPSPPDV